MRRIAKASMLAVTAAMATSIITAPGASAAPQSGVPNGYKLAFSDEFNGNSLDTTKWGYQYGCFDPGQRSQAQYTDSSENVSVHDGYLSLTARYSPTKTKWDGSQVPRTCKNGSTTYDAPFTSGMITTKKSDGEVLYAAPGSGFYAEARIKLPSARSSWSSFWGTGTKGGWPGNGEIDIFESKGYDPSYLMSNVHTPRVGNPKKTEQHQGMMKGDTSSSQSEFHTYGMLKTADAIEFYFDGKVTHRVRMSDIKGDNPFADPENNLVLKLNHMVGGNYLTNANDWSDKTYVDATGFADDYKNADGATMYVDYVRVYTPTSESTEQPPAIDDTTTPENPGTNDTPGEPSTPETPGNDDNATPSQPEQPATPAEPSNPGSNDNSNQEPPATKPDGSKPEPPAATKPDSDAAKPSTPAKPTPDKPSQPGNNGKPSTPAPSPSTPAPAPSNSSTPSTGNSQSGNGTSNSNGSTTTTPAKPGSNQGSTSNQGSRGNSGKPSRLANTGSSPWFRPIVFVWNSFWGWLTSWRFW